MLFDDAGRVLLVRKAGTTAFMNPGGKPEPGESAAEALCRELAEELGLTARPEELTYVGRFTAPAANEPDHIVDAEVFSLTVTERHPTPRSEIVEAVWVTPTRLPDLHIAPLAALHLLPFAARRHG